MRQPAHGLRHRALAIGLFALVVSAGPVARAHGPAPVALEVLAHDGERPTLLRTNVGLAVAAGDGTYTYVCPSRWDGNENALAAASADGRDILVHSAGLAFLSRDGGCTFAPLTGDDLYVVGAAWSPDGFLIVAEEYPDDLDPSRSRLLRVVDGALSEPPLELPGPVDGVIATEGGWLVSGHAPVGFVADERGVLATFETTASRVTPRASRGGDVWLRTTEAGAVFLELFREGALVDRSPEATTVQGPVRVGDRWLALIDGALYAHDDTWRPLEEVPWTCLRAYGGHDFACSLEALYELSDGGAALPVSEPVFSMRQLGPPAACGDADAQEACGLDWAHFGGESGWLETLPATSPTTERRVPEPPEPMGDGGCATRPGAASPRALALLLALALLGRRRQAPRSS